MRDEWKKEAGYSRRVVAETAAKRMRMVFSDGMKWRGRERRETEPRVRCAALNRMKGGGTAQGRAV